MRLCRPLLFSSGLVLALGLVISGVIAPGSASAQQPAAVAGEDFNDRFENTNRTIFEFNQRVDRAVLLPAAKTYRTVVPPPMQQSVHDFLRNLDAPLVFANDVLQGEARLAGGTLARFAINTTIGIGGMFDVATRIGIPYHDNDLGITAASWGVPEGPYLIVPVLGPSNPRDLVGKTAESFADPGNIFASGHHLVWAAVARGGAFGIDERSRNIESLADIERTSLDYYATIRSLYRQRRAAEVRHEEKNLPNPTPLSGDPGASPRHAAAVAGLRTLPEVPLR